MKTKRLAASFGFIGICVFLPTPLALAADGTWNKTTSNLDWSNVANWSSAIAGGSGFTAYFDKVNLTADVTVNLNANVTIGHVVIGDTTPSTAGGWRFWDANSAQKLLTLAGTNSSITVNTLGTGKIANFQATIAGTSGMIKNGVGTLQLSRANTYTGLTNVTNGTLAYGIANAISTGAVTVDGSSSVISLGTFSDSVGTVTVANGGSITGTTGVLTSTGAFQMQSGSVSAKLAGAVALNKTTSGTLTLSGVNAYTGQTTVADGKLIVDSTGSIGGTSLVSIGGGEFNYNSSTPLTAGISFSGIGGVISGTGTISTGITVSNGNTYSAGTVGVVGRQSFTAAPTFANGSIFSWDLASSALGLGPLDEGYDVVELPDFSATSGTDAVFKVVLNSGSFSEIAWDSTRTWSDIFQTSSKQSVAFDGVFQTSNVQWWEGGVNMTGSTANEGYFSISGNTLTWNAVPEPSSELVSLTLGFGVLLRRRR